MAFSRALAALSILAPIALIACTTGPAGDDELGAACGNGKKDDAESDVDCGGACPTKCTALKGCLAATDCGGGFLCVKSVCAATTSTDGTKSGTETDVDCGGPTAPPCDVGAVCTNLADCAGNECNGNVCTGVSASDGVQNGSETDVDCGGGAPIPACADGKKCADGARDCTSKVCTGNVCQPPKGNDGVQNGDETATDCGGTKTGAPPCAAGVACLVHEDCASGGCGFDKKCAVGRSCTRELGGVTCGAGEVGEPGATHESCCAQASLDLTAVKMDKYHVTAGRMRAFIERVNGDVRTFAKTTAGWQAGWDALVPSTVAEANVMLGSYWAGAPNDPDGAESKRSCAPGGFGGHTYWTAPDGDDFSDFTQNELDVKALNCVGWHLARAFCSWEGGRLPSAAEITDAWKNGNSTTYPWGSGTYNAGQQDERLNHQFNYGYPNPAGRRLLDGGAAADISWHISPPGRFPLGRNKKGVEIAGDLLHWVSNGEYSFDWTLSWERHGGSLTNESWASKFSGERNGYYAIGFRCAYP